MPDYWWFEGASVETLVKQLLSIPAPGPRLEVRVDKDTQAMTFRVTAMRTERVAVGTDINESHPCPPDCGG